MTEIPKHLLCLPISSRICSLNHVLGSTIDGQLHFYKDEILSIVPSFLDLTSDLCVVHKAPSQLHIGFLIRRMALEAQRDLLSGADTGHDAVSGPDKSLSGWL